MSNLQEYQKENDQLLKFILNERFFKIFKNPEHEKNNRESTIVELNITSECNLKCEYCYLAKYGDKLYPPEIRKQENICNNLKILLEYFEEQEYKISAFDLFSGEIWGLPLGNKVLDLLYDYKKRGAYYTTIMIPSNCCFILNDDRLKKVEEYIEIFDKVGVRLCFSASVDGLIIEEKTRPFKNITQEKRTEENFYNKLFDFCLKYGYGYHPMVSASGIEYWIENFNWWMKKFREYKLEMNAIMLLEVRNDDWTDDKIKELLKFLNYVIDFSKVNIYYNDLLAMAYDVFTIPEKRMIDNYYNIGLRIECNRPTCSISRSLVIRLGDLAIGPCHRTCYDKFLYGFFEVQDNKIVDIKAENVQLAWKIYSCDTTTGFPQCDVCKIKEFCMKGCFGAQLEATNDLLYPCPSVCKMFKAKNQFLYNKYKKMNLLNILLEKGDHQVKYFVTNQLLPKLKEAFED